MLFCCRGGSRENLHNPIKLESKSICVIQNYFVVKVAIYCKFKYFLMNSVNWIFSLNHWLINNPHEKCWRYLKSIIPSSTIIIYFKKACHHKTKAERGTAATWRHKLCRNVTVEMNFLCVPYAQLKESAEKSEVERERHREAENKQHKF